MLQDFIVSAGLPYVTYLILTTKGVPLVTALAIGAVFPVLSILLAFVKSRRLQAVGILTLSGTIASIIGSLYFQSPYLALAKGSLVTGMIGLAFGASLLFPRPLVFYLATSGDASERQKGETLWQSKPPYRNIMRFITLVWCLGLLGEALLRLVLIPLLPVAVFLPLSEVMWMAAFGLLTVWSWRYGRNRMRREASS
ncbi:hypothetical protein NAC44_02875 [Allorhizobium sp. BGMRC 0089]|uniref:VC0807 family protein n=1 Tax=Allorhizobium sonneratiae TaxID=2934936 RepID=UPI002034992B|nr:VC0807 family protein [Allorhizobium sonneratiae]MCM2291270.1 hypothetical protein [Allorhizobium sonneratiae]